MAIFLSLFHENSKLIGISAVHGNQTVEKTSQNIQRLLKLAGINLSTSNLSLIRGNATPITRESIVCPEIHGESGIEGA
jgi:inosine-uridine nucleoside N-ribohydrolase